MLEKKSFEDMTREELKDGSLELKTESSLLIYNYSNKDS
jgi:hypothetical protein